MRNRQAGDLPPPLVLLCPLIAVARADVQQLSLDDALERARTRGFDVLLADANRLSAEEVLMIARTPTNPYVMAGWMHMFNYFPHDDVILGPCIQCAADGPTFTFADQAAIENALPGKLALRRRVAEWALRAARMSKYAKPVS